jgi:hypothetical protein
VHDPVEPSILSEFALADTLEFASPWLLLFVLLRATYSPLFFAHVLFFSPCVAGRRIAKLEAHRRETDQLLLEKEDEILHMRKTIGEHEAYAMIRDTKIKKLEGKEEPLKVENSAQKQVGHPRAAGEGNRSGNGNMQHSFSRIWNPLRRYRRGCKGKALAKLDLTVCLVCHK